VLVAYVCKNSKLYAKSAAAASGDGDLSIEERLLAEFFEVYNHWDWQQPVAITPGSARYKPGHKVRSVFIFLTQTRSRVALDMFVNVHFLPRRATRCRLSRPRRRLTTPHAMWLDQRSPRCSRSSLYVLTTHTSYNDTHAVALTIRFFLMLVSLERRERLTSRKPRSGTPRPG
jgi:hypothetical protein